MLCLGVPPHVCGVYGFYVWEFNTAASMVRANVPYVIYTSSTSKYDFYGCCVAYIVQLFYPNTSGVYGCFVWEFHTAASMVCADVWECLAAAACRSPLTLSPACTCSFHPFNIS